MLSIACFKLTMHNGSAVSLSLGSYQNNIGMRLEGNSSQYNGFRGKQASEAHSKLKSSNSPLCIEQQKVRTYTSDGAWNWGCFCR